MCRISVLGSMHWDIWDHEIKLYPSFLILYILECHHNNTADKMGLFYLKIGEKGERRWREVKREEVRRRKEGEAKGGVRRKRGERGRTLNSLKDRNSFIWTASKPWLQLLWLDMFFFCSDFLTHLQCFNKIKSCGIQCLDVCSFGCQWARWEKNSMFLFWSLHVYFEHKSELLAQSWHNYSLPILPQKISCEEDPSWQTFGVFVAFFWIRRYKWVSPDYLFEVALPDGHKPQALVIPMEKRTASAKGLNQQWLKAHILRAGQISWVEGSLRDIREEAPCSKRACHAGRLSVERSRKQTVQGWRSVEKRLILRHPVSRFCFSYEKATLLPCGRMSI